VETADAPPSTMGQLDLTLNFGRAEFALAGAGLGVFSGIVGTGMLGATFGEVINPGGLILGGGIAMTALGIGYGVGGYVLGDDDLFGENGARLTRFHGVFAPTSRLRDKVVPRPPSTIDGAEPPAEPQVSTTSPASPSPAASPKSASSKSTSVPSTYRLDWAALLKRVFGLDVLKCPRCQSKMRLIACIEEPDVAKTFWIFFRWLGRRSSSTSACELKPSRPCGPRRRL
jgi:hypothetical protein